MKTIPILMYHSIEHMPRGTAMRSLHVPPKRFKFQMWLLKILGYKGLSMRDLTPYLKGEKIGKVIGITFDDGYKNNLKNAAPILKKYRFSATCYIVSQRLGESNIWDLDKGINQRPLMTKNEIDEWLDAGLDIGAHTQTHADLSGINDIQIAKEVKQCKLDLEKQFNINIVDFCYPFGKFNTTVTDIVISTGYHTATTMMRGSINGLKNLFELKRIPITHHTLPHLFLTKLLTNYENKR